MESFPVHRAVSDSVVGAAPTICASPVKYDFRRMDPLSGEYALTQLERVVFGAGSVARLGSELDRLGASRAVVVTGRTLGASPLLAQVTGALGDRAVHVFTGARQHVPSTTVSQLAALLDAQRADCVVSFGGGSPIDACKAAVHLRLTSGPTPAGVAPALPHIAVPTTLSAGEFTAVAGITDDATLVKHAIVDPRLAPRVVVLDPALTVETPRWLWAASGMRAVDHAVETLYATHRHPVSSAQAAQALATLATRLSISLDEARLADRLECQTAAWMSVQGIAYAGLGLSHALGHQIGPRWNVAHGVTSCITLPHAMRAIAERAPERFQPIAAALGVPFDRADPRIGARACADAVAALVTRLGLPARLRDVGVPADGLDGVADVVFDVMSQHPRAGCALARADVAGVLTAAF
jgi:alcohol dehydrogenase class IV